MKKIIRNIILIISTLALICTGVWLYQDRSWSAGSSFFGALAILIATTLDSKKSKSGKKVNMSQNGGKNSKNFQAGGDINIHNIK